MLKLILLLTLQGVATEPSPTTPLTIAQARADVEGNGDFAVIALQLVSGKRYDDVEPWCGSGEKYEGQFQIVVNRSCQETVTLLTGEGAPKWLWTEPFSFQLADYNHDGLLDFNLGQYGACRGWEYYLFTITRDGHVKALPVEGGPLFNGDRGNATYFPVTAQGFRTSYLEPESSRIVRQDFRWDRKAQRFRLLRTRQRRRSPP